MSQQNTKAPSNLVHSHKLREITELLIKHHNLHEGLYDLVLEFGINVGSVGFSPEERYPGAALGVRQIGLVKSEQMGNLTVDASEINPKAAASKPKAKSKPRTKLAALK